MFLVYHFYIRDHQSIYIIKMLGRNYTSSSHKYLRWWMATVLLMRPHVLNPFYAPRYRLVSPTSPSSIHQYWIPYELTTKRGTRHAARVNVKVLSCITHSDLKKGPPTTLTRSIRFLLPGHSRAYIYRIRVSLFPFYQMSTSRYCNGSIVMMAWKSGDDYFDTGKISQWWIG
jgi:hypothetical protein